MSSKREKRSFDDEDRVESRRSKDSRASLSNEPMETDYLDPNCWDCTVCTYKNKVESFKCEICDSRKGTSTRKPRLNQSVVQQQTLAQNLATQPVVRKPRFSDGRSRFSPESSGSGQNSRTGPGSTRSSPVPGKIVRKRGQRKLVQKPSVQISEDLVDKNKSTHRTITVNGISFIFTEYPLRSQKKRKQREKKKKVKEVKEE